MHDLPPADCVEARVWDVLPPSKLVSDGAALRALSGDERASTEATLLRAVEGNCWVGALRLLGYPVAVSGDRIPVEEGETSLNANFHQALASLLPCSGAGLGTVVLGNMAFGNHSLVHTLERMANGFIDPRRVLRALKAAVARLGPDEAIDRVLAQPSMTKARGELTRRPGLRDERALRFPAALFEAPSIDVLRRLVRDLDLGAKVARLLLHVREAMPAAGLTSFADLALVNRAVLIRELAELLEIDARGCVPLSLEHLLMTTAGPLVGEPLERWVTDHHQGLSLQLGRGDASLQNAGGNRTERRGAQAYRVLNYFVPAHLIDESVKRIAGRQSEHGWSVLRARFADGAILKDPAMLARRPVSELLAEGYGLSGKLTYHGVSRVNGGRVCNLVFRTRPDVFSALADEGLPNRVMALAQVTVCGAPPMDFRGLNLLAAMDWIHRSLDPRGVANKIFQVFRGLAARPGAQPGAVVLGQPGIDGVAVWQDRAARVQR